MKWLVSMSILLAMVMSPVALVGSPSTYLVGHYRDHNYRDYHHKNHHHKDHHKDRHHHGHHDKHHHGHHDRHHR